MVLKQGRTGSCKSPLFRPPPPSPQVAAAVGCRCFIAMPDDAAIEKALILRALGGEGGGRGARGQGMGVDGRASRVPGVGRDREGAGKEGAGGVHHPAPPVSSTH